MKELQVVLGPKVIFIIIITLEQLFMGQKQCGIWEPKFGISYQLKSKHPTTLCFFCFVFYTNHPLQGFKSHCSVRGYKLLLQQKLIDPTP